MTFSLASSNLQSLSWLTDLSLSNRDAEIIDCGQYLKIRTPTRPGHVWENFLLFRRPPTLGDCARWRAIYEQEFPEERPFRYVSIGWESVPSQASEISEFVHAGFTYDESAVLTAKRLMPSATHRTDIVVKPVVSEAEWSAAMNAHLGLLCHTDPQRDFGRFRFDLFKLLERDKLGHWFVAKSRQDEVMGHLGIFIVNGIARFQQVLTYPPYRKQSIARSLVYSVSEWMRKHYDIKQFVIVSEMEIGGRSTYESVGFSFQERQENVSWFG